MRICSFLWTYYGYPTANYEGVNVEEMRYRCGRLLRRHDDVDADNVAGVPDSGIAHAIGYSNESGIHYSRPFILVAAKFNFGRWSSKVWRQTWV